MEKKLRRVIWAIDAFEKAGILQRNAIRTLTHLIAQNKKQGQKLQIEPVFVLQEQAAGPSLDFSPVWLAQYRTAAEQGLQSILSHVSLAGLLPAQILSSGTSSTAASAYSLIQYAMKTHADLIVTNTHSKTGLKRMFLGSFAESLLLRSPVPVLTVGPHIPPIHGTDKILFPTDFGRNSFKTFKNIVATAHRMKRQTSIVLFHGIPYPVRPYLSANVMFPSTYWNMLQDYLRREQVKTRRTINTWTAWAKSHGVKVKAVVDKEPGSLWEGIIDTARKQRVDLIAMETKAGPVTAALAGSTVRQTVRHAHCPVWILGSRYAKGHLRAIRSAHTVVEPMAGVRAIRKVA